MRGSLEARSSRPAWATWINLQGKDRKERLEKNKQKTERENKEFNPKMKIKTELKLHVMYEGWKKDDPRHSLVNKQYIAKTNSLIVLLHYLCFAKIGKENVISVEEWKYFADRIGKRVNFNINFFECRKFSSDQIATKI